MQTTLAPDFETKALFLTSAKCDMRQWARAAFGLVCSEWDGVWICNALQFATACWVVFGIDSPCRRVVCICCCCCCNSLIVVHRSRPDPVWGEGTAVGLRNAGRPIKAASHWPNCPSQMFGETRTSWGTNLFRVFSCVAVKLLEPRRRCLVRFNMQRMRGLVSED